MSLGRLSRYFLHWKQKKKNFHLHVKCKFSHGSHRQIERERRRREGGQKASSLSPSLFSSESQRKREWERNSNIRGAAIHSLLKLSFYKVNANDAKYTYTLSY